MFTDHDGDAFTDHNHDAFSDHDDDDAFTDQGHDAFTDNGHDAFTDHDRDAFTDCLKCLFLTGFPGSCKHTVPFSDRTPRCSFNSDTPTLKPTNQHAHIV